MISRVDGVGFSGIKSANKKVMRNLVNANKQAPKGISRTPVRMEKDIFDKHPLIAGMGTGSYISVVAVLGSSVLERFVSQVS